jgi:hypothetical protein
VSETKSHTHTKQQAKLFSWLKQTQIKFSR